jgi:hypothetical protein
LLQGAIRASGMTQTDIDEKISRRRGYLSHVFQRRVDLKVEDLLRILEVIQVEPRLFFHAATTRDRAQGGGVLRLIAERLDAVEGLETGEPEADAHDRELLDQVRQMVRALLTER